MKKLKSLLLTLALLLCSFSASAHDFEVDGIYYNITDSEKLTVEVTFRGSSDSEYSNEYTGSVVIPETVTYDSNTYSVTSIGGSAFSDCSSLTSVTIPNGVTSIGGYAFRDCVGLTTITIPNSVTSLGFGVFSGCSNLRYTKLSDNILKINLGTFSECMNLEEVILPQKLEIIEGSKSVFSATVFQNCEKLKKIILPNGIKEIGDRTFIGCKGLININLPQSLIYIGENAFQSCSNLESIDIPENIKIIKQGTFWGCKSLKTVKLPALLEKIEGGSLHSNGTKVRNGGAFGNCTSLESIVIPQNVTKIDQNTFRGASSLKSIVLGNAIDTISIGAFMDCSSLETMVLDDNIKYIGENAFNACKNLKTIYISNSISSIEKSCFKDCIALTSIMIPNNVRNIGYKAFSGCTNLTSITIPNSVTSIGDGAFEACTSTKEITCKAETPPTTGTYVFEGIDKTIPLYVPKGSVLKYKAAANWKDFVIIREIAETETDVYLTITDCANGNVKLKVDEDKPYFTLKIEAETGWHVHSVTFNDGDVTAELSADGEYTTPAIGTDSRLNIVYAQGSSSVNSVSDSKIKVWASGNNIIVDNAILDETINVYTLDGMKITSVNANSNRVEIPLTTGVVYIVKVADKVLKVAL